MPDETYQYRLYARGNPLGQALHPRKPTRTGAPPDETHLDRRSTGGNPPGQALRQRKYSRVGVPVQGELSPWPVASVLGQKHALNPILKLYFLTACTIPSIILFIVMYTPTCNYNCNVVLASCCFVSALHMQNYYKNYTPSGKKKYLQ